MNSKILTNSLFQEEWWLDAVAGKGNWSSVDINSEGKMIARLPYIETVNNFGLTQISSPPLTQTLGPALALKSTKISKKLSYEKKLYKKLLELLPDFDEFNQSFHYSISNWMPFYWANFTQTTKYTYVLDTIKCERTLWDNFDPRLRTAIRKAEKELTLSEDFSVKDLYELVCKTYENKSLTFPIDKTIIKNVFDASISRESGKCFFAIDKKGLLRGAVFIVWDNRSAYYLLGAKDLTFKGNEATSFLLWEAIKFLKDKTEKFDFEGSMNQGIENFFRSFGATPKPYFSISYKSSRIQMLDHFTSFVNSFKKNKKNRHYFYKATFKKLKLK